MDKGIKKALSELIYNMTVAMTDSSLYSGNHPMVIQRVKTCISIIGELLETRDSLSIMILQDEIVVDRQLLQDKGIYTKNFIKKMNKKGIENITFKKQLTADELTDFVTQISRPGKEFTATFDHITTGRIEVGLKPVEIDQEILESMTPVEYTDDDANADTNDSIEEERYTKAYTQEEIEKLKEAYYNASRFKKLDIVGLEDMVVNFIAVYKREANILNLLPKVRTYSEYTYTHATNVSIISMFQAEAIGLSSAILHQIGIAALLHDVGKMFIPTSILDKKEALTPEEWEEMKRHSFYGAKYLATLKKVPKLAIVAALEHHMKYDGSGYPAAGRDRKGQHICSQIIAIADFFDALRTERPYRKPVDTSHVLGLLKHGAGREFNPFLANNFVKLIKNLITPQVAQATPVA